MVRSAVLALMVSVMGILVTTSQAFAIGGGWQLDNSGQCGGTCHLRGVMGDISAPYTYVDQASGSEAYSAVDAVRAFDSAVVGDDGILALNGMSCGQVNDTFGTNRTFAEAAGSGGGYSCFVLGYPVNGTSYTFRVQRKVDSSCTSNHTPYCFGVWNDGVLEIEKQWGVSEMGYIQAQTGFYANLVYSTDKVEGDYGLASGTMKWSRTSDVHTPNQPDTWTTIQAALCISNATNDFFIGSLASGFNVHFYPSHGTCP